MVVCSEQWTLIIMLLCKTVRAWEELCEQHKVQHTTSIVSINTYSVTYACIKLSEGVLNSDVTDPEIEFRRERTSAHQPDLLVPSLQHIGRNTHCEPSAYRPDLLIVSLPFSIPELVMTTTALRWRFWVPVGPFIGDLRFQSLLYSGWYQTSDCRIGVKWRMNPVIPKKGRRRSANIFVVRLRWTNHCDSRRWSLPQDWGVERFLSPPYSEPPQAE